MHNNASDCKGSKARLRESIARDAAIIFTKVFKSRSQRLPMGGRRIWKKYANSMLGNSVQCFTLRSDNSYPPVSFHMGMDSYFIFSQARDML